ncbi:ATP-binding protein [Tepidicella baoligensis]|uniref:ATP-binding protein n=1 Tax=Tepidicella baoligensis TaxID=2707016 RepID=UPI0015D9D612|nr:ATP-binding protein [Tepidicella baoligensis]
MRLHQHLYLRIWLALTAVIVVMTLLLGWLWRAQWEHERAQRPGGVVVLRDAAGQEIGRAQARRQWVPGQGVEFEVPLADGQTLTIQLPRPSRPPHARNTDPFRFIQSFWGFTTLLLLIAVAVALGAYPVVRRLTQRLEVLQQGVARWGEGRLDTRLPVQGQDEVAFLAERFNAAADRVQALLASHKALLANASHELRSPLARIRMGLELLASGTADAKGRERQLAEISRNIAELDQLIDEILLASRLDLTDPNDPSALGAAEDVDLLGLAAEECARVGATLAVADEAPPVLLRGYPRLLRRLLRNLLENARRHGGGPAPDAVSCTLETVPDVDGRPLWRIRVADTGPGVPDAYKERVFEPFFRLPGQSEREGGVGLGLALVRAIARRHRGDVRCIDQPGGGACFVVDLKSW